MSRASRVTPRLRGSQDVALTAQVKVGLGQGEPVHGGGEGLEAVKGGGADLHAGDRHADRLPAAASDPSAQLVEL